MGSCAESLARIDADRQTVIRACGVCPTWNDEKAIGNREAGIGLLPLLRPVAFFNNSTRHGWSLSLDPFKDGSNNGFNSVEIRPVSEVEKQPCGLWFRWRPLPDTGDALARELSNDGID